MCAIDFAWTTSFNCGCRQICRREQLLSEQALTITLDSDKALPYHIHQAFAPEQVNGFRCDKCQALSSTACPAMRKRSLCSLSRFLRVKITAPVTSTSLPSDFHQHGPLKEYEELDLSQLLRCPRKAAKYTLRAAVMYSARHHWVCLHGQTWVTEAGSTLATTSAE
jgi:hypothetical protein